MKLARTRFRPAPKQLDLDVGLSVCPPGTPSPSAFARWISAALGNTRRAQLSLRVVDEEEGRALNHQYRDKDYATNVLTFALNEGEDSIAGLPLFGDIVLTAPVVAREANEQGKSIEAHYAHLTVHGVLHLQGHDHQSDEEAEAMESLETRILARLGYPDPYAEER